MLATIRSYINETEVRDILKRYSDRQRETERDRETERQRQNDRETERQREAESEPSVFLLSAAIWSYLAHYWPGLNYIFKAIYKTLGNG